MSHFWILNGIYTRIYSSDFENCFKVAIKCRIKNFEVSGNILYDFSSEVSFFSFLLEDLEFPINEFLFLLNNKQLVFESAHNITLPSPRLLPGEVVIKNEETLELTVKFFGSTKTTSINQLLTNQKIFIYTPLDLDDNQISAIIKNGAKLRCKVDIRTPKYAKLLSEIEKPLAFISHDSRNKIEIAAPIANGLQQMRCPVWYDEYSLRVGDNLRESIEKGLKECKKCILILSPDFLSNNGWTKIEFETIFQRQLMENTKLFLPIWFNVSKRDVYNYSPSLANVVGLDYTKKNLESINTELKNAIMDI